MSIKCDPGEFCILVSTHIKNCRGVFSQAFFSPLKSERTVYRFMSSDSDLIETVFQFLQISLTAFLAFDDNANININFP